MILNTHLYIQMFDERRDLLEGSTYLLESKLNRKWDVNRMNERSAEYLLSHCLYFTVSRFARQMDKLAEEVFASLDIAPSYAFLLITINDYPGITQKELCQKLSIAPSTSTRFIDKLVKQNYVERKKDGKHIFIYLTESGKALCEDVYHCLEQIYLQHAQILNQDHSGQLIRLLHEASEEFDKFNR